jgi:SSS family solute:Na+ symporter
MDLYSKFSGDKRPDRLVKVGRIFVLVFVVMAALVAPALDRFSSIFAYIQEFQGFISPGILAIFLFGFFSPRTPRFFGAVGIAVNVLSYAAFKWWIGPLLASHGWWYAPQMAFLDRMALCFILVVVIGCILTWLFPLRSPVVLPENRAIDLKPSRFAAWAGAGVVVATAGLYLWFW